MINLRKDTFPHVLPGTEKTDGSYVNRPFCAARWRKRRKRRETTVPQMTFFCFLFFLERKERRTISFLEEKKHKTLRDSWVYVRQYCAKIDEAARNRMELIVPELAKRNGVTEKL